jgi:putative addiction module component (TIGR02574 family)
VAGLWQTSNLIALTVDNGLLLLIQMINWLADDADGIAGATLDRITEPDVEAAWSAEIERRLVEIDAGTVELIPWDDVRLELFGESGWRE